MARGQMNMGGLGFTGVFGTIVQCKADDSSMYCSLAKLLNTIFMLLMLFAILYLAYISLIKKKKN